MRISGLASGMDTEQMVKDLMRVQRLPIDKMAQQRQVIQWQMDDYREINRKLDTFRNNIFDTVMRAANMQAKKVSSTSENRVTATALSSAGNLSLRIKEVKQLASAASNYSSSEISEAGNKINPAASLGSQSFGTEVSWEKGIVHRENIVTSEETSKVTLGQKDLINTTDMVVKVNGKMYEVFSSGELTDDQVLLNTAEDGTVTLQFKEPLQKGATVSTVYMTDEAEQTFKPEEARKTFQVQKGGLDLSSLKISNGTNTYEGSIEGQIVTDKSKLTADNVYVNLDTGQIEFLNEQNNVTVTFQQRYMSENVSAYNENGKQTDRFVFTADQSLNTVFTELNRSKVGISGFYDEHSDKVSVTRTLTGQFNPDSTTGDYKGEMVFAENSFFTNVLNIKTENEQEAKNAIFTLNGLETQRTSNTFTVAGMTITLKEKFGVEDGEVTLSSTTDTDKTFDTIKKFVDEYNELLDFVNGKLKEERHRDFKPLTDEEREALSDKEIEKWEEKARSGLLRNDSVLRSPFDQMRLDVYSSVNGELDSVFKQLSTIGITTSKDFMERGKLELDEDKLRAAIEQDPEGVFQLFSADGNSFNQKGIARRVRETLDTAITAIAERAGGMKGKIQNHQFTLGRNMDSINDRISSFERRLLQVEDRYWRQFSAMEKAMQQANTQAESLYNMLMGGAQ
ncbi:flagellar filament capping protein FliD [bacterium LRH843]|nr:flagellar filament capping protein FliD [bacterium LRH843]